MIFIDIIYVKCYFNCFATNPNVSYFMFFAPIIGRLSILVIHGRLVRLSRCSKSVDENLLTGIDEFGTAE